MIDERDDKEFIIRGTEIKVWWIANPLTRRLEYHDKKDSDALSYPDILKVRALSDVFILV